MVSNKKNFERISITPLMSEWTVCLLLLAGVVFSLSMPVAAQHYQQTNLVSDVPGLAQITDANLVKSWGIAHWSILEHAVIKLGLAFYLLLSYSLGLGVPFLIAGLFTSQASNLITNATIRHAKLFKYINIFFGFILIILGILAFTQNLNIIANFGPLNRWLLQWNRKQSYLSYFWLQLLHQSFIWSL